jgi:polyphosphate kinase
MAKLNSLVDPAIIEALYDAAQAGVRIELAVRGICCLRPGVRNLSERITVVSVVDRFLEHGRIVYFHHGGEPLVYMSSADWMPRNLDRRIELMIPVEDETCRRRLIAILQTILADTVKGRLLLPDGTYVRRPPPESGPLRSQEALYREACAREQEAALARRQMFQPHRPATAGEI